MKRIASIVLAGLFVVGITLIGGSDSFAGSGSPDGSGVVGPPWGVAVQSDAKGIKLTGVVTIEFYNIVNVGTYTDPNYEADVRIVARLTKGSVLKTVSGINELGKVSFNRPADVQAAIEGIMEPIILDEFFGGDQSRNVTLKSFDAFGEEDFNFGAISIIVADIVLAVK